MLWVESQPVYFDEVGSIVEYFVNSNERDAKDLAAGCEESQKHSAITSRIILLIITKVIEAFIV